VVEVKLHLLAAHAALREGLRTYRDEFVLSRSHPDFRRALELATPIDGFTSAIELSFLYHASRAAVGPGAVVEIGSYLGRSTIVLARAALDAGREPVVAVDPHTGELTFEGREPRDTFEEFLANVCAAGVDSHVRPLRTTSLAAAESWKGKPVRLLFVDGLHTKEAVLADVHFWRRWWTDDCCVVLDDYLVFPAVRAAVRELRRAGLLPGRPFVVGKMIAFGPARLLSSVPTPPGARTLGRLGDRALSLIDVAFRDRRWPSDA
jgi:predicted O-methyltransferase YrrM